MKTVKTSVTIFFMLSTVCLTALEQKETPFISTVSSQVSYNKHARKSEKARKKILTQVSKTISSTKGLKESLNGKRPLYSITVTRKGMSVLWRSEQYFLGEIIKCLLNNSDSVLNTEKLERYIGEDIQEFLDINSKISSNIEEIKNKSAQIAAKKNMQNRSILANRKYKATTYW